MAHVGVVLLWGLLVWIAAHETVAKECKNLGAFYFGNTVYECKKKE